MLQAGGFPYAVVVTVGVVVPAVVVVVVVVVDVVVFSIKVVVTVVVLSIIVAARVNVHVLRVLASGWLFCCANIRSCSSGALTISS